MASRKVYGYCDFCKNKAHYKIYWFNPTLKVKQLKKACIACEKIIGDENERRAKLLGWDGSP